MQRMGIVNGDIVTEGGLLPHGALLLEDGKIAALGLAREAVVPADTPVMDVAGQIVAPGYIDVHVHGAAGYDTMDATPEALAAMARFFARHGVTSFLPTTVTGSRAQTLAAIAAVADFQQRRPVGAQALGIHLEGPYINRANLGAQNPEFARSADPDEYPEFFRWGNIRLISLAPEDPANLPLIPYAVARGAAVAIGHSSATYEEVMAAVELGLTQATHTYNAMTGLHHRKPGATGAALTCDRIYAQIIVDLIHVHPAMVKLLVRAKGLSRTVLITDAMRATGMADGTYDLGGQEVIVVHGEARLPAGNLAGSTLTMDRAVRNVRQAAELSTREAICLATLTPAQSVGVAAHKGRVAPGCDADLVILDRDLNVVATVVGGEVVYQASV